MWFVYCMFIQYKNHTTNQKIKNPFNVKNIKTKTIKKYLTSFSFERLIFYYECSNNFGVWDGQEDGS